MIDYKEVIDKIHADLSKTYGRGKVANYIPALAEIDPKQYGIAVATTDGELYMAGGAQTRFSIQSISKVYTLALVYQIWGDDLWKFVGREPSGNAFNSLVQLEHEHGIPRNPFINAGALAVTDRLISHYPSSKVVLLDFIRSLAGSEDIYYDKIVARSEQENAYRNLALAHFMKSFGNIENDVDTLIDVYCNQCSVAMNCVELAKSFLFFAHRGLNPHTGERILSVSASKRLSALMFTCGFYDESGDFAFKVGMPGKSGVGGGVVAIIPGKLSIAVWSPELNPHGNSCIGIDTLERFTTDIGISIF